MDRGDLASTNASTDRLRRLLDTALRALDLGAKQRGGGPLPPGAPAEVAARVGAALDCPGVLPGQGVGATAALSVLTETFTAGAVDPAHPYAAAHLHCPPLAVAVGADLVAGILNQSLDSWDQGPAAIAIERAVISALAALVGYDPMSAGGVMTSGGSESNLMGLLLGREAGHRHIFCSEHAHFSIQRAASLLGLGPDAVTAISVDRTNRMNTRGLAAALIGRRWPSANRASTRSPSANEGRGPCVVATAGTTGTGSIDPLPEIAQLVAEHDGWLHVDAAYGGGALFSGRLAPLLAGLERADSIALDLHKIGWQPVPAGVFLARDESSFEALEIRASYLNPADDEEAGYHGLLGRSLRTTRRADAFKVAVTMRALGRSGLGAMVESCHDLAHYAAGVIAVHPRLRLAAQPVLTTIVFQYAAVTDPDRVNASLRRRLLREGRAVVGRTELDGAVWLKLTLLNPNATERDIDALIAVVVAAGDAEDSAGVPPGQ